MPRVRSPDLVAKSIIEKQLRFIAKKDPKDITASDLDLALNYFKAVSSTPDTSNDALAEVTTEDLQKVLDESE